MLDLAPKRVEHGTDLVERAVRRFSEVVDQGAGRKGASRHSHEDKGNVTAVGS